MNNINPSYLSKDVKVFVRQLIRDYDYKYFNDLPYSDLCEFSALLIKASGKNHEQEFLTESNHLDQTIGSFAKCMLGVIPDDEFLYTLKENTVKYFTDTMESIFDLTMAEYKQDLQSTFDYDYRGLHHAL
jgi:hypothetical protein